MFSILHPKKNMVSGFLYMTHRLAAQDYISSSSVHIHHTGETFMVTFCPLSLFIFVSQADRVSATSTRLT